jgi:proteasome lid subunit RPN8/RPN11
MIVTRDEFAQISAQAIREYPFECCGFVLDRATPTPGRLLLPCRNEQNELHRKDPKTYPRDARTAYRIHGQDVINMERLALKESYQLSVLYHSHVDVGAYFSPTDRESAKFDGEPLYPDTVYLVLSVRKRSAIEVDAAAAFRWDAQEKDFIQVPFELP